jgi:hypothetical protein
MKHEEDLDHFEAEITRMQEKLTEKDEVIGFDDISKDKEDET